MKFLANENFPQPSVQLLRSAGYDVESIVERQRGISDSEVIELAVREQRIILTFDRDYGELLFRYAADAPPAVVYFRVKGSTPLTTGEILLELLHRGVVLVKYFTVIEHTGIRQRMLP